MVESIFVVSIEFFKDINCSKVLNNTIIGRYIYPCANENCYDCNYISKDHNIIFNHCQNNQIWLCNKELKEDSVITDDEALIMWITFLLCCCCIFWCCCN